MKKKRLGDVLREKGSISSDNLEQLVTAQNGKVTRLGELIYESGLVDKTALIQALEEVSRIPYMDCSDVVCERSVLQVIPRAIAEQLVVLPIRIEGSRLVVVMAEPQNLTAIDELRFTTGKEITPRLGFRSEILDAIARNYSQQPIPLQADRNLTSTESGPEHELEFVSTSSRQSNLEAFQEVQVELRQKKTPAVRLVSNIILQAMAKKASDIHIEPQEGHTAVRIRVDGVLREMERVPRGLQNSLVSRVKILSDMDIAERRAPQDGRFMVSVGARQVDMRVSTLPTQFGEKVVMRLLETSAPLVSFAQLGFPLDIATRIMEIISAPQGMLLVTGPTGSGKSTTLYSALNLLRKPSVNIVTVEDPVEYVLPGINQVHVNVRAGLTFASCLRSMLRQDPNVIMVGEIRDQETAEIAMKASQTGHVVLSTLHTNDSISAVVRLLDLGIPGYMIAASVTGVLAQRLVRKLCSCQTIERVTPQMAANLAEAGVAQIPEKIARAAGCAACDHTGYQGRVGIYELLPVDESVRSILRSTARIDQIRQAAGSTGMRRLQDDALDKLAAGVTTLEEIRRVIPFETIAHTECSRCGQELLPAFRYCPSCGARNASGGGAEGRESSMKLHGVLS
jgi:type IV pilus assembly protein PilB